MKSYSTMNDPESGAAQRPKKTTASTRQTLAFGLAVTLAALSGFAVASTKSYAPSTSRASAFAATPAAPAPYSDTAGGNLILIPVSNEACELGALDPDPSKITMPDCKDAKEEESCLDPKKKPINNCWAYGQGWSVYKKVPKDKCVDDPTFETWVGGGQYMYSCQDISKMAWFDGTGTWGPHADACKQTGSSHTKNGITGIQACCRTCGGQEPFNPPPPTPTPEPTPRPAPQTKAPHTHKPTPDPTPEPSPAPRTKAPHTHKPTPEPSPRPTGVPMKLVAIAPLDCPGQGGDDVKSCDDASFGDICISKTKKHSPKQCYFDGKRFSVFLKLNADDSTLTDDSSWQGRDDIMWGKKVAVPEATGADDDDCTGADCGPSDCHAIAQAEWTLQTKNGVVVPGPREQMCASIGYTDLKADVPAYVACAKSCASGDREAYDKDGRHEICRTDDPNFAIGACDNHNNATLPGVTCAWVAEDPATRCLEEGTTQDYDEQPAKAYAFRACGGACSTCHNLL